MDLKEIQLVGFKSFADKTAIRLEDGVTCIVGPNGCGKSNIADAVRWVLGEQSAKTLRGTIMEDVIFNGTVERKKHSACEVTLVFDNSNRIFDLDVAEVAMTRRVQRNSEGRLDSKYLLNGQACRLKDLVTLFHGIGLGKEGYSIIGQGKVEQIMNAKPEARRLIFEEAMGLMIIKNRKQEIESKIESSTADLFMYRQRLDEAERRLGPLSKQAEDAKKYNTYADALRVEEANTYVYRYEHAEGEKDKYRKEISAISDKIIELTTKIELINRRIEENREQIASADLRLSELNDRRVELSVGNERKDGELRLAQERIKTYRSQIKAAGEALESGKVRLGEIDDEIARTQKKTVEDEKRITELELQTEALQASITALDKKIAVFEQLSDESRASQMSTADEVAELKKNLGTLSAQMQSTKEKITELGDALKKTEERKRRLQDELTAVKADLTALRKVTGGGAQELEERQEEIREMQSAIHSFNQELFTTNGQIASLKENLEMYVNLKNRHEGYKESVRRLLSVAKTNPEIKKHLCGALADVLSTEQKYETAIETALGGAMQNIVTPTPDDAKYLIEYLKRTGGGVVTFLPVVSMRPRPDSREIQRAVNERGALGLATELVRADSYYYNVISNLLGNTLVCDNIENANNIAKKYGNMFRIVTLDGDVIATSGSMTGGSRGKNASSFLSVERKVQECQEMIARKEKQVAKIKMAIAESQKALDEAEEAIDKLREKYQDANSEIAGLVQRETALLSQIQDAESDEETYEQALQSFQQKLAQLKEEEENSSLSEEEILARRRGAEAEMATQKNQCEEFKEERAQKSEQLRQAEVELATLKSAVDAAQTAVARLSVEKEELVSRLVDMEYEITDTQTRLNALEAEAQSHELTEEERQAVQEVMDEITALTEQKEKVNAQQLVLEEEKEELQSASASQSEKRIKREMEISKIDTTLEGLRQRVEEAYELDYEGCLAYRKENFNVTESATTIATLKRQITMLGAVNPHAIEEYDYEQRHCAEMVEQRDDLQKAIDDLQSALDDIRAEMTRIFDAGFAQINENFKTTFKELFGGGNAELQIDYEEGEDPLNAGIEIVACPAGKKLTKISLLSGGERALTAIAILFAILKSYPMPFCILDEIEAALDDANVDRFASYLKRFKGDTQFIVITHRKPTMNQADSLFGVTMQEKGVSKIVSVKLAEVESKLGKDAVGD
ncbi:MAG: chromosome segregation protein SMC [Clostridia bacterium]|nr:chromosome segregation protein SMC [Clostridia bacterium]